MKEQHGQTKISVSILGNVVLLLLGLVFALGLAEILMRAFPNWVPSEVRVNPPTRRVKAFIDEDYDLRQSDGDLFYYMRGSITPLSSDQDQIVAHVHMITDAHGFRNSPPENPTYDIVALGDSFTRGSGVADAWPQKLADYSGRDVFNLGDVGLGPQDELKILQQYGLNKHPQWVILAYFEGNDLYDAASYEQATPFLLFRFGRYILDQSVKAWHDRTSDVAGATAPSKYRYPIMITINNKDIETTFFSYYISWLSLDGEAIEASKNYGLVGATILKMRELSEENNAQFLMVYVPSKEHIYLPYVTDHDTQVSVFSDVPTIELDSTGFLQFASEKATPELTHKHMDDQAELLADFAAENEIRFLDLTPVFQQEASNGVALYYPYDTHWNQVGHDLAAETISKYIEKLNTISSTKTPGH